MPDGHLPDLPARRLITADSHLDPPQGVGIGRGRFGLAEFPGVGGVAVPVEVTVGFVDHPVGVVVEAVGALVEEAPVRVVTMTVPLWLWVYHRVRGVADNASPYAGLALLAGAIVMLLAVEGFQ